MLDLLVLVAHLGLTELQVRRDLQEIPENLQMSTHLRGLLGVPVHLVRPVHLGAQALQLAPEAPFLDHQVHQEIAVIDMHAKSGKKS